MVIDDKAWEKSVPDYVIIALSDTLKRKMAASFADPETQKRFLEWKAKKNEKSGDAWMLIPNLKEMEEFMREADIKTATVRIYGWEA